MRHLSTRRGRPILITIFASAAVFAASCGGSAPDNGGGAPSSSTPSDARNPRGQVAGPPDASSKPSEGGALVFGIEAEPEGLDPTRYAFSSSGHTVASAVFDPLATLDENANAVPFLAKSIQPSNNYQTWTIELREGVLFHDDTPLDVAAVIKNLDAARASQLTKTALAAISTVTKADETHVVVQLSKPVVNFPLQLTTQAGYMIAPIMIDDNSYVDKPIGTGPFVLERHVKNEGWAFKKNPKYWRPGLPHLEAIKFLSIPDNAERLNALRNRDLDVIHTSRPAQVKELRTSNFKRVEYGIGDDALILLNTTSAPFDSPTARLAAAHAIDSARWRNEVMEDVAQPANGPFAPGQPGHLADNGMPTFDVEKARALVKQYETESGQAFEFEYLTQDDPEGRADTFFFVSNFEAAGMKVTVKTLPQINLVAGVAIGKFQAARFRLYNQFNPDGDSHFWRASAIVPAGISLNFPRYANPAAEEAIDKAMASTDPATRDAAYQVVSKAFATDVPIIFLGRNVWVLAADPEVNGIYAAANGSFQTIGAKTWIGELWIQH